MMSGYIRRYITRGGSWYGLGSGVAMGLSVLLAGCGGYESNFSCKGYPDQATCESVSEAYEKRFSAGQKVTQYTKDQKGAWTRHQRSSSGPGQAPPPMIFSGKPDSAIGKPVITPVSALRVTVFPWKDTKKRLHDQSRHYLIVDEPDFIFGHMDAGGECWVEFGAWKGSVSENGADGRETRRKENTQWECGGERHDGECS
jgi:type IV conjugative transfer system lipoprotein TraV